MARAQRRAELIAKLDAAEGALAKAVAAGSVERVADPGAVALATYIQAITGAVVAAERVADWLVLVGVIALEVGSALAGVLVASVAPGRGTRVQGVQAAPLPAAQHAALAQGTEHAELAPSATPAQISTPAPRAALPRPEQAAAHVALPSQARPALPQPDRVGAGVVEATAGTCVVEAGATVAAGSACCAADAGGFVRRVGQGVSGPVAGGRSAPDTPDAELGEVAQATAARPAGAPLAGSGEPADSPANDRTLGAPAGGQAVVDLLRERGGVLVASQRTLGELLGWSKSRTNDTLHAMAAAGTIRLTITPRGTVVELAA